MTTWLIERKPAIILLIVGMLMTACSAETLTPTATNTPIPPTPVPPTATPTPIPLSELLIGDWEASEDGDTFILTFEEGDLYISMGYDFVAGTYTVDFSTEPAQLDMQIDGTGEVLTIIEFEDDNNIRIEDNIPGEERPTLFSEDSLSLRRVSALNIEEEPEVVQLTPPPGGDYRLRLLISIEEAKSGDSPDDWHALLSNLQYDPSIGSHHGHNDIVTGITFSPDGTILASAGDDLTILLWDTTTWEQIGDPLIGHLEGSECEMYYTAWCPGQISSLAFNPDGSVLASGGRDMTVRLWDIPSGEPIGEPLAGHEDWISDIAFSPDGSLLASASIDGTMRMWDPSSGTPVGTPLSGHEGPVNTLAFSPDGSVLASGGWDNTIILWNPQNGVQIQAISGLQTIDWEDIIWELAFSPDGEILASTTCGSRNDGYCMVSLIEFWDPVSGEKIDHIVTGYLLDTQNIAFSSDGSIIVSLNDLGPISMWDPISGIQVGETLQHFQWGGTLSFQTDVAFSPDGRILATAGCGEQRGASCVGGEIRLWDPIADATISQTFSQTLLDLPHATTSVFTISADVFLAAIYSDNSASGWERVINVFDLDPLTGEYLSSVTIRTGHEKSIRSLVFNPAGSLMATTSRDDPLRLWDLSSGELVCESTFDPENLFQSATFNHDGSLLASAGSDHTIRFWDVDTCNQIGDPLSGHSDWIEDIAFSPDGSLLASVSQDDSVRLWDTATGEQIGNPFSTSINWFALLTFSPDGSILASGANDIRLWDIATGEQIGKTLRISMGPVTGMAFSPDGQMLASSNCLQEDFGSSCVSAEIVLWDVTTGEQVGTSFIEGSSFIGGLMFNPDGDRLISAGCWIGESQEPCSSGEIRWWDMDPESWIERACEIAGRNLTQEEWEMYFPEENYRLTCPQWPAGE